MSTKRETKRAPVVDKGQKIARARAQASGMAVVKGVNSGDQIIVMGGCKPGQVPPTKQITLSGIITPRLARGKNSGADEPFAWAAREHLRKMCIGQTIYFSVNHVHTSGREYADVFVGKHRTNLAHEMVRNGFAKVMTNRDGTVHSDKQEMYDMMERAQALGVGMWAKNINPDDYIRKVSWIQDEEAYELYKAVKGKSLNGIIDYVRDGSTFRIELLDSLNSMNHSVITLYLAGVQAPDMPPPFKYLMEQYKKKKEANPDFKGPAPKKENVPAFAPEAKSFVECRLLHRTCKVQIQAMDAYNNLFGTVLLPQGNIACRLLEMGLSKMVEWSARSTLDFAKFSALEATSKQTGRGLFKDAKIEEPAPLPVDFMGRVVYVNGGDSLTVSDGKADHKLTLASVRAPRQQRGRKSEDFAFESREYVRRKLIGKRVKVLYEYSRTAPKDARDQGLRYYVTLIHANKNLGQELVQTGYATVIRHRRDEIRSRFYDDLLTAEKRAMKAKKGVHSDKKPEPRLVIDLTYRRRKKGSTPDEEEGDVITSQAKGYLTSLQNVRELRGIVEYVFSSTRYKIFLPSENLMITFLLAGCRIPSQDDDTDGVWAKQALNYTKDQTLQHDVTLKVEAMAGDQFVGLLSVGKQRINNELLRMGLVDMFRFSAEKSSGCSGLMAARDEAKEAKRNFWHNWQEKQAARIKAREEAAAAELADSTLEVASGKIREGGTINISVTEVIDGANFYATVSGNPNAEILAEAMGKFSAKREAEAKALEAGEEAPEDDAEYLNDEEYDEYDMYIPPRGEVVAGQYEDGSWHRVKIQGGNAEKKWKVQFIDFGNYAELSAPKLLPLPRRLKTMQPLARLCTLSCCEAPPRKSEHFVPAGEQFTDFTFEQKLIAKVNQIDREDRLHLTLNWAEANENYDGTINSNMIKLGFARLGRPSRQTYDLHSKLQADEEIAKREHNNIWEYGDVSDGEGDDGMWAPHKKKVEDADKKK